MAFWTPATADVIVGMPGTVGAAALAGTALEMIDGGRGGTHQNAAPEAAPKP